MKIALEKHNKEYSPYISDSLVGKAIPAMFGYVSSVKIDCINTDEDPDNSTLHAVYKLPTFTTDIGTAYLKDGDIFKAATVESVDYESGLLYVSNGRKSSGSTLECKLVDCVGYLNGVNLFPADALIKLFDHYAGIKYTDSNFNKTEFEDELGTIEYNIGFVIEKELEFWDFIYTLSQSCGKLFYCDYNSSKRITARIKDFSRASTLTLSSVDLLNADTLPIESDRTGVYSSVVCKYGKSYYDNSFLSVVNNTYYNEVVRNYRKENELEIESFLTSADDAMARAYEDATNLADVPMVAKLEVAGAVDLRIYDVITVSIEPDTLSSSSRDYVGNKDCLVIGIDPDIDNGTNTVSALIIPDRVPEDSQGAILSSSFTTIEREKTSTEIAIEEVAQSGIIDMVSETLPPGEKIGQVGKYQGNLYEWNGTSWDKIESVFPLRKPVARYDCDSLAMSGSIYKSPIIDNSGNGNHSIAIIDVTPV